MLLLGSKSWRAKWNMPFSILNFWSTGLILKVSICQRMLRLRKAHFDSYLDLLRKQKRDTLLTAFTYWSIKDSIEILTSIIILSHCKLVASLIRASTSLNRLKYLRRTSEGAPAAWSFLITSSMAKYAFTLLPPNHVWNIQEGKLWKRTCYHNFNQKYLTWFQPFKK